MKTKKVLRPLIVCMILICCGLVSTIQAQKAISLSDVEYSPTTPNTAQHRDAVHITTSRNRASAEFTLHQNGGISPGGFRDEALSVAGGGVACGFATDVVGYARLFDLSALRIPKINKALLSSVDYVLNFNRPNYPITVSVYSYPAGTVIPTRAAGTLLASVSAVHPASVGNTLHRQEIPLTAVDADAMILVTIEALSSILGGAIFAMDGGPRGGAPELAPTYVFGCPSLGLFPDYTDLDGFFLGGSILMSLNGLTLPRKYSIGGKNLNSTGESGLVVYPNPASKTVNIQIQDMTSPNQLVIYDLYGRAVWRGQAEKGQQMFEVDISGNTFAPGVYMITASNDNGSLNQRLVIADK